jgi:lipoprotein-releasing system ATP-binding protein
MSDEPAGSMVTEPAAARAPRPLLIADDVEKEYRGGPEVVKVLRGVNISLSGGEVVTLVGASGIGKTTLLYILGALDRPTAGRVLFDGQDVFARSESGLARFRRQEIGFVFQFYNLLGEMTALENAMLPALLLRRSRQEAEGRAVEALNEVGLGDRLRHRPGELSGGEQQRVAIARALMNRPRLILADEPTGNLDPKTSEVIYDLFLQLQAERGLAFLIATHNQDLARKADRGYRIIEGRARPLE